MKRIEHIPMYGGGIDETLLRFWCPGCQTFHAVKLQDQSLSDHRREDSGWGFSGDFEKPSLSPSVVTNYRDGRRCHLWLQNGEARFLGDSTHSLAGKSVMLPDVTRQRHGQVDNTDAIYKMIGHDGKA